MIDIQEAMLALRTDLGKSLKDEVDIMPILTGLALLENFLIGVNRIANALEERLNRGAS